MIAAYFISAFLLLNATPSLGWIQWTQDYPDISSCQKIMMNQEKEMIKSIRTKFGKRVVKILDWECMTHQDAVNRNTKLGH